MITGLGKSPEEGNGLPTPVFWPGEFHGLYNPWGCKESDMTERLSLSNNNNKNKSGDMEERGNFILCNSINGRKRKSFMIINGKAKRQESKAEKQRKVNATQVKKQRIFAAFPHVLTACRFYVFTCDCSAFSIRRDEYIAQSGKSTSNRTETAKESAFQSYHFPAKTVTCVLTVFTCDLSNFFSSRYIYHVRTKN